MVQTFDDYDEALTEAGAQGMSLCATYRGAHPVYFLMPTDVGDDQMSDAAFEVREGRPRSAYERGLIDVARRLDEMAPA